MRCTGCGQEIPDNAKFCSICGKQVGITCKSCGSLIKPGLDFCTQCGAPVNAEVAPVTKKKRKSVGKKILIVLAVIIAILCVGLVVVENVYGLDELIADIKGEETRDNKEKKKEDVKETELEEETDDLENTEDEDLTETKKETENTEDEDLTETKKETESDEVVYDATEGGIHKYEIFIDDCTWTEAFVKATQSGGYLVRINSADEYEYILYLIEKAEYEDIQFYMGARRDEKGNNYYWVDTNNNLYGEVINSNSYWASSEWMNGEPSYVDGDIQEAYLDFYYYSKEERWVWNDIPDDIIGVVPTFSGKIGYIVEYEE